MNYNEIKAVNSSLIKECLKSPMHGWLYLNGEREESQALSLGLLSHSFVLTPESIGQDFFVIGKGERSAKYEKEAAGRKIVRDQDFKKAKAISESVYANKTARDLLLKSTKEQIFTFDVDGVPCKARIDAYTMGGTLIDFKTANAWNAQDFVSSIFNYHYDAQLAFYKSALEANKIEVQWVQIIQTTTDAPFATKVYEIDQEIIDSGFKKIEKVFPIAKALLEGWKPEADETITKITMPEWARSV